MARNRFWLFTINNPETEPDEFIAKLGELATVRYAIFQREQGEEGTEHFQGYLELTRTQRLSWVRNNVSARAHWESRRGTQQQAIDYCSKVDTRISGPWSCGEKSPGQGSRTDIIAFRDAIRRGDRKRQCVEAFPMMMAKYPKFYDCVRSLDMPVRQQELVVRLNYGATGTGKTRYVYDNFGETDDLYVIPLNNGTIWFDGYDRHEVVLIDDFCGRVSKVPLNFTLRILDRYPVQVPSKGSHQWWLPRTIIITSNFHPREWYIWEDREQQYEALMRRITEVYVYTEEGAEQVDKEDFKTNYSAYYINR